MSTPVNAGTRLARLPVGPFYRRIILLIGIGTLFDGFDIYIANTVLSLMLKTSFSTLAQNAVFISATFVGMTLEGLVPGFSVTAIESASRIILPAARRSARCAPGQSRAMRSVRNRYTSSRRRAWPAPFAHPARCPDSRPCTGSGRCRSRSLRRATALRRIGATAAGARRRVPQVQPSARWPAPAASLR